MQFIGTKYMQVILLQANVYKSFIVITSKPESEATRFPTFSLTKNYQYRGIQIFPLLAIRIVRGSYKIYLDTVISAINYYPDLHRKTIYIQGNYITQLQDAYCSVWKNLDS